MHASAVSPLNTDPARFPAEGYCISERPLPPAVVTDARERLDARIAALRADERPEWLVEPHVHAPDWRFWLELCRHPQVLDTVQACMGCEELTLMMSHLIVKPAGDGLPILWHQDNTYWPSVDGDEIVTVWLALDDADTDNGCMEIIPTTHAGHRPLPRQATDGTDLLRTQVEVTPALAATALPIQLRTGMMSVHDSFVIHGSKPNRSARRRAGYTMRYGNPARVRVDLATHGKPVYYVRGDGAHLAPGVIDLRPGRALPATSRG